MIKDLKLSLAKPYSRDNDATGFAVTFEATFEDQERALKFMHELNILTAAYVAGKEVE